MEKTAQKIDAPSALILSNIFGSLDENISAISKSLEVEVINKDGGYYFYGDKENVSLACRVVDKLSDLASHGEALELSRVKYICECAKEDKLDEIDGLLHDVIAITYHNKAIKCKTVGQKRYIDLLRKKTIVLSEGPAGTGKTYLAVASAVNAMRQKQVDKIILTRPAVEAGEKLGFLPGDLAEKVNPYLRPLYDALQEMLGMEQFAKHLEKGAIEIAPLAYMRGRTLNNAYIILDEAQNATREQIKMFLTRLGDGSRMVINGDLSQTDLPKTVPSGFRQAINILKDIPDIGICTFSAKDVVRHPLVQLIVRAYEAVK